MNRLVIQTEPQIRRVRELARKTGNEGLILAAEETITSWYAEGAITAEEREHLYRLLHESSESADK